MENMSLALKVLGDANRLKLIQLLMEHNYCVTALSKSLSITEAAVSQHLRILRKYEIVTGEKRGYYTHYVVNRSKLNEIALSLQAIANKVYPSNHCTYYEVGDHRYCEDLFNSDALVKSYFESK